tara:strand:- start:88 stop:540 length:453 start_codon:yes stop_codon:yes gene_type:complete
MSKINKLIIMQGHSSSGKSSFARQFAKDTDIIISTDDYFMDNGAYKFNEEYLEQHHKSTFNDCVKIMEEHSGSYEKENAEFTLWLDNTNTKPEHVKPYLEQAKKFGFQITYVRMTSSIFDERFAKTHWTFGANEEVMEQQKKNLEVYKYD